ncbi:MAG TPA: DEAD/DEAH box helicase family protein, partial [Rhizobacter sp.]
MKSPPLAVHGGAVYPYSLDLHDKFRLESRFEDEFELCLQHEQELWVPRRFAPVGGDTVDLRTDGLPYDFQVSFKARHADQQRVVDETLNLLTAGVSHIVQAPTGYGKTFIGARMAGHVRRYTLVLTTKEDLMQHWRKAAREVLNLPDDLIGEWRGDTVPRPDQPFVVGLVHSVLKGPQRYPDDIFKRFGFVLCDEVHRMGADQFTMAMWWLPARLRAGLSATPY